MNRSKCQINCFIWLLPNWGIVEALKSVVLSKWRSDYGHSVVRLLRTLGLSHNFCFKFFASFLNLAELSAGPYRRSKFRHAGQAKSGKKFARDRTNRDKTNARLWAYMANSYLGHRHKLPIKTTFECRSIVGILVNIAIGNAIKFNCNCRKLTTIDAI